MFAQFESKDRPVIGTSILGMVFVVMLAILGMLPGGANAQSFGQADIPSAQGRAALNVQGGQVIDVQATAIEVIASNETRGIGGVIGGLLGAAAGRKESWQGQAAIGSLGALFGAKIAEAATKEMRPAMQVVVRLDNGRVIAVVQEMNGAPVGVGDAVYVVGSYPAVRVVKAATVAAINANPQPVSFNNDFQNLNWR